MNRVKPFSAVAGCLLLLLLPATLRAATPDPVADLDAQYQLVLEQLKKPSAKGVLVTEVQPESPAAAGGLRAGDVIVEYYATKIETLKDLREQVAEALARSLNDATSGKNVLVRVRRLGTGIGASDEVILTIPRAALGIRAVEVEINVPVNLPDLRNLPPNLRGTLDLDWDRVLNTLAADAAGAQSANLFFRTYERLQSPTGPDETWTGWQTMKLLPGKEAAGGTIDMFRADLENPAGPPVEHNTLTFHFKTGDYTNTSAFLLDEASSHFRDPDNTFVTAAAKRLGDTFRTTLTYSPVEKLPADAPPSERHEYSAPLNAITQAAVPLVAAAMPQRADQALGVRLLSVREFIARPGYIIATRGKQPMPTALDHSPAQAWQVDLLHTGVVIESYWFSDDRHLLAILTHGYPDIIHRRAANLQDASAPERELTTKPAATLPGAK